jgi:predicted glycosyltransferase involved in capsule biosynthesis
VKDFSIVIAHRGNPLGLWATIHSCEVDLVGSKQDYEYVICSNGEKLPPECEQTLRFLDKSGRLGAHIHTDEALSPPTARNRAAQVAKGKILFFFDNHCLVARDYFRRALADFEHYGDEMHMLHSTTRFYLGESDHYHYRLLLKKNFWAESVFISPNTLKPYRIAAAGHGGFVVRRDVWNEVGGYWDGFTGYGGEEIYFDLKMALLDKKNWIDPKLIHYHYTGARGYPRHYSDDYYRNMLMCANIIGGESWMYTVYESFVPSFKMKSDLSMFDLLAQAMERSGEHAAQMATIRKRTLDEQLVLFREQQIAH